MSISTITNSLYPIKEGGCQITSCIVGARWGLALMLKALMILKSSEEEEAMRLEFVTIKTI